MDPAEHKRQIREAARAARLSIADEDRDIASSKVSARALYVPEIALSAAVLAYAALPEELDPTALIETLRERGARVALPRVCAPGELALHWVGPADELEPGFADIPEPPLSCDVADIAAIDLVLVPGVAFDHECNRIGFGGGYYDTLLSGLPESATRVGLAFDEQVVDRIPAETHDAPVDIVLTPTRVLRKGEVLPL